MDEEKILAQLSEAKDSERKTRDKLGDLKTIVRQLVHVVKLSLLWAWWIFGILGVVTLWFFPIPQLKIQAFVWLAAFIAFQLLSKGLYKIKEIEDKYASV